MVTYMKYERSLEMIHRPLAEMNDLQIDWLLMTLKDFEPFHVGTMVMYYDKILESECEFSVNDGNVVLALQDEETIDLAYDWEDRVYVASSPSCVTKQKHLSINRAICQQYIEANRYKLNHQVNGDDLSYYVPDIDPSIPCESNFI